MLKKVRNLEKTKELEFKIRENTLDDFILWENFTRKSYYNCIKKTLKDTDVWLDIGACFGAFALSIHDKVKRVYCFEPNQANYLLLRRNMIINKTKNIFAVNDAIVGNNDKERIFYLNNKRNRGAHSFLVKRGRDTEKVVCENINHTIKLLQPNKVKMDCEGSELEIIENMDLSKIEEMVFEFHFNILCRRNRFNKYWDLIDLLKKHYSTVKYPTNVQKAWGRIIYCRR